MNNHDDHTRSVLENMTVVDLKIMCRDKKVKGYSNKSKSSIIDVMLSHFIKNNIILKSDLSDENLLIENVYTVDHKDKQVLIGRTKDWRINITAVAKEFGKNFRL